MGVTQANKEGMHVLRTFTDDSNKRRQMRDAVATSAMCTCNMQGKDAAQQERPEAGASVGMRHAGLTYPIFSVQIAKGFSVVEAEKGE